MATSRRSNCGSGVLIRLTSISLVEFCRHKARPERIDLPLRPARGHGELAVFHTALCPQTDGEKRRAVLGIMPPSTIRGNRIRSNECCGEDKKCPSQSATAPAVPHACAAIPLLPCCPLAN